jgi:hypothetical protein
LYLKESKALGEGRGKAFIVFLKRGRKEIAVEAGNSRKGPEPSEETIPEGQAGANYESHWKKMIGKSRLSGRKPNVRFDEGELEIELLATTPALYSTESDKLASRSERFWKNADCFLKY